MDESARSKLPGDPPAPLVTSVPTSWTFDRPTGYCECDAPSCKGKINIDGMWCCQTAALKPKTT